LTQRYIKVFQELTADIERLSPEDRKMMDDAAADAERRASGCRMLLANLSTRQGYD
jgi:hypothetical protein